VILVTTGTNGSPFDRLLTAVAALTVDDELVVQYGPSTLRVPQGTNTAYLPYAELEKLVRRARLVITHGGVGSILLTLMNGIRPVVVPRIRNYGEAVDDHQLTLASRLAELGLVELVEDVSTLAEAIETMDPNLGARAVGGAEALAQDVASYVASLCGGLVRT
jgi:UDP-N-acetylglucosamine transferase subunit ALG13